MIDHLVAEYAGGTTAAEIGQRYGLAKNSILRLVRQAGGYGIRGSAPLRRLSWLQCMRAGPPQKEIAQRLGRSQSAVWHCRQRWGRA